MAFDTFDRLIRYRDPEVLQSGIAADVLVESVKRLADQSATLDPDARIQLSRNRKALDERPRHWGAIITSAGTRYQEVNLKSFDAPTEAHRNAIERVRCYLDEIDQSPTSARSLLFIGPPGTGKDHLMMAVLRFCVLRFGLVSAWSDGQAFFGAVRDTYASEETETPIVNFAVRSQLFAISDPIPSNGAITEHQRNVLFRLFDGRYRHRRPTLATLNVATRDELNNRLGDSLADRLCENAVIVPCNWPSYRQTLRIHKDASMTNLTPPATRR
jgi:DNA replication protein DnaC